MGTGVALAGGEATEGALRVKVMTDEQMEVLRKQISVYAAICERLVDLHRTVSAHQDSLAGMRLGNLYCDSLVASAAHKLTARQRWTPTPVQLQILESIFDQGNGTPSKQKIKEITTELSLHGQISEANVYNWFQNRRARSKRKQTVAPGSNIQSEEIEADSPKEKKCKPGSAQSILNPTEEAIDIDAFFQGHDRCSDMLRPGDPEPTNVGGSSRDSGSLGHISFYGTAVSDPTVDRLMGDMAVSGAYNAFHRADDYDGMVD